MKPAGLLLLVPAGLVLISIAAETAFKPTADAPPTLSLHLKEEIRASLPAYVPPPPPVVSSAPPPPDPDSDVLVLPKVTVQEKRIPMDDVDLWLGERAIQQKAMAAYQASMSDFGWFLNSWHIPFLTPSAAARARAFYEEDKKRAKLIRLNGFIETTKLTDPKAAAELRKAVIEMQRADEWQNRPAGGR